MGRTSQSRTRGSRYVAAFAAILAASSASFAGADERADTPDRPPAARLACVFENGTATAYEGGTFVAKPASTLSFEISAIDLEGQTASLRSGPDQPPLQVRIVRAINANHYLEVVNEGFLNLTTIYDKDSTQGVFPAVHSRHLGLLGQPFFAQYTGACREN